MLEIYTCAVITIAALILTIVLSVILIVSEKEKRRQMKKIKTAAGISALTFPLMAAATIYLIIHTAIDPVFPDYVDYEIPDLTGLPYVECKTAYTGLLDLYVWYMEYSSEYPEGEIISHFPESGAIYTRRSDSDDNIQIRCVVSKGPRMVTVPNVVSLDLELAENICKENFIVEIESEEYSDEYPAGTVISISPERGEKLEYGGVIKFVVSKGKESDDPE